MDLKKIEEIMRLMRKHGMLEVYLENRDSGETIRVTSESQATARSYGGIHPRPQNSVGNYGGLEAVLSDDEAETVGDPPSASHRKVIRSPSVGTYYAKPNPQSEPFVSVGQKIKKGDVLCIVEAMKLMNHIESEIDGTLLEVLVIDGQSIEYDQPLFLLVV